MFGVGKSSVGIGPMSIDDEWAGCAGLSSFHPRAVRTRAGQGAFRKRIVGAHLQAGSPIPLRAGWAILLITPRLKPRPRGRGFKRGPLARPADQYWAHTHSRAYRPTTSAPFRPFAWPTTLIRCTKVQCRFFDLHWKKPSSP